MDTLFRSLLACGVAALFVPAESYGQFRGRPGGGSSMPASRPFQPSPVSRPFQPSMPAFKPTQSIPSTPQSAPWKSRTPGAGTNPVSGGSVKSQSQGRRFDFNPATGSVGGKPPAKRNLTPGQAATITDLGKSGDPRDQKLAKDILQNRPLTPADEKRARQLIKQEMASNSPDPKRIAALTSALQRDEKRKAMQGLVDGLGNLANNAPSFPGVNSLTPVDGGGSLVLAGGATIDVPPGIDSAAPAALLPNDADAPSGSGLVVAVDPRTVEAPAAQQEEVQEIESGDGVELSGASKKAAPRQVVRTLRLSNATEETVTVNLRYETVDADGEKVWVHGEPGGDDEPMTMTVAPGAVVVVKDRGRVVKATRVRLWASNDSTKWERFKDTDLPLVPEKGAGGYESSKVQTFNVAFR